MAFPVVILVNAVALLLGDGSAANISLCLGRRQQQEADDTIGHAATLIAASGLCAAIVSWCFAPQIARLFGATDTAWPEAAAYLRTIAWGLPFQLICPAFTAIIRADGHPRYSMGCMITGAVLNLILDPVFIFPLGMGVVGAGIATVIGQVAAGVLFLAYLPRLHTVRLRRQALRPTIRLTGRILALGVPSLLTQILTALVQITLNNLLRVHGAASVYGSDIALSVYGMMMKVYQIAHSMFVGVSSAVQPINGYNFGAKHFLRVRQTFRTAAAIALVISGVWFLVFQLFPRQIGMLFVSDSPLYLDCAQHCFRLYMAAFFLYGLHLATASFFQGIGRPGTLPCHSPGPAGRVSDSPGYSAVRPVRPGWCPAGRPHFRRADLPPELAAGPAGVCRLAAEGLDRNVKVTKTPRLLLAGRSLQVSLNSTEFLHRQSG